MSPRPRVLSGEFDGFCWIRIEGNGTVANSAEVKEAGNRAFSHGVKRLVVDLEECPMMDSTFMGTLTGLAIQSEESGGEGVEVVHLCDRALELLEELGLNHILNITQDAGAWADQMNRIRAELSTDSGPGSKSEADSKRARANLMLEAHEQLCELDEDNAKKFKDVVDLLRKNSSSGDSPS
jgi:anti-sigma B factor antagonist